MGFTGSESEQSSEIWIQALEKGNTFKGTSDCTM